jgi:hypothetical protein
MGLQASFGVISRIVEQYESGGRSVKQLEATVDDGGDLFHVVLDVPVSLCAASGDGAAPSLTPETATLTDGGGLAVEFAGSDLAALPDAVREAVSASEQAVRVEDGSVVLTVELTIDPSGAETARTETAGAETAGADTAETETATSAPDGAAGDRSGRAGNREAGTATGRTESDTDDMTESDADDVAGSDPRDGAGSDTDDGVESLTDGGGDAPAAVRDESVPPYDDVPYLRRLYETHDTFTAMSEAIEMDVSSETVRRYMIEAGVHDPSSYDIVDDGDEEDGSGVDSAPQPPETADDPMEDVPDEELVTDGIGLPEGIRIEDVADAVVDSMTVYEVSRKLGLERHRAKELLKQLNLIDLAMRRVDADPERAVSYEEVADRIRQCAPTGAARADPRSSA